jgi:23S rRNA pseudouridine2604 synthase
MSEDNSVRLAKRMVELGLCSRREADAAIEQGLVKVDGEVVRVLGSRVTPQQQIELVRQATPVGRAPATVLYHRGNSEVTDWPGVLGNARRSEGERDTQPLLASQLRRLSAFGAIEPGFAGLVVLTQDHRLAQRLQQCEQEFLVNVERAPDTIQLATAARGIGGCKVSRQSDRQLRVVLQTPHAGTIAELCTAWQSRVLGIRCIRIGRLALAALETDCWRRLRATDRF